MTEEPKPPPNLSFFSMGWNYAKAHPKTYQAARIADRWSPLWKGRYSRRWWIDGFNAYRDVLDAHEEAKRNPKEKKKP